LRNNYNFSHNNHSQTLIPTNMNIVIRIATRKDLLAIQSLMDVLNRERAQGFTPKNRAFHQRIKPYAKVTAGMIRREIFIVAEIKNLIVGFVRGSLDRRASYALSRLGSIDEVCVIIKHRGRGVAKRMLIALDGELKKRGCDHLTTHTDWENRAARALYHSYGMNEATVEFWKKL